MGKKLTTHRLETSMGTAVDAIPIDSAPGRKQARPL